MFKRSSSFTVLTTKKSGANDIKEFRFFSLEKYLKIITITLERILKLVLDNLITSICICREKTSCLIAYELVDTRLD